MLPESLRIIAVSEIFFSSCHSTLISLRCPSLTIPKDSKRHERSEDVKHFFFLPLNKIVRDFRWRNTLFPFSRDRTPFTREQPSFFFFLSTLLSPIVVLLERITKKDVGVDMIRCMKGEGKAPFSRDIKNKKSGSSVVISPRLRRLSPFLRGKKGACSKTAFIFECLIYRSFFFLMAPGRRHNMTSSRVVFQPHIFSFQVPDPIPAPFITL